MGRGKTCLVVDDSRVVRKVASKIAASLGYRVVEAENGEEGLARCKQHMPDLVLTDWQMPVMSGIEFVGELRAIPTHKAPTVVFCTQMSQASDIHEGIAAGADDYIVKPFDEAQLRAKLLKLESSG
ncbi:response regulator [Alteraurantiacibacter aquimixticola]|uniref:Response regulator n=1 Tax=Alteraurantiacibacter aquimixticola TaxID=2489173 RepID=A0A4T3F4P4_9SPHN|nr:response regulator [Alteraurantiacibacter aquimixticola]